MEIKVNKNALEQRIKDETERCIKQIQDNAKNGINVTELYIPKDIGIDVKDNLIKEIDNINFCVVDRRVNSYTGKMDSFSGMTIGEDKYYKVKILNLGLQY